MKPLRIFVAISESIKYSRAKLDDINVDSSFEVQIGIVAGTAPDLLRPPELISSTMTLIRMAAYGKACKI